MVKNELEVKGGYASPILTKYGTVRNLTGGSIGPQGDMGGERTQVTGGSERAIKENILEVGRHDAGFGLYTFDYKTEYRATWGKGRQFGVMADEVEAVRPDAVSLHEDGYRVVNYSKLGITRH